jgi:hypothetical protein
MGLTFMAACWALIGFVPKICCQKQKVSGVRFHRRRWPQEATSLIEKETNEHRITPRRETSNSPEASEHLSASGRSNNVFCQFKKIPNKAIFASKWCG